MTNRSASAIASLVASAMGVAAAIAGNYLAVHVWRTELHHEDTSRSSMFAALSAVVVVVMVARPPRRWLLAWASAMGWLCAHLAHLGLMLADGRSDGSLWPLAVLFLMIEASAATILGFALGRMLAAATMIDGSCVR